MPIVYTLIGDMVASRRVASRGGAQTQLRRALEAAADLVPPVDRLEATVGDEFQGVFEDFGRATLAALVVRLELTGVVDVRCGIGRGEREVFAADRTPMLQDGPAWWSARAAIDALAVPANRSRRTWYDGSDDTPAGPPPALANAFLTTRDAVVDRLNERARAMLLLSLQGRQQREIANGLSVSASAVSQAFARGIAAVRDAQRLAGALGTERP